jgi:FkbM family methyltransferase
LPFALRAVNVLDLGANIGAAGVWLVRRHGSSRLVAAEPVPANAALARLNFARNGIVAEVIEAAVGPPGPVAHFELSSTSTLGRVAEHGIEVPVVAIEQLLERFPAQERVELVKLDIEGAEQQLFDSRLDWLARVDCLIVELHRDRVDVDRIVGTLRDHGFSPAPIGEGNLYGGLSDVTAAFSRSS